MLDSWEEMRGKFIRVIPKDYLEMQERIKYLQESGLSKHKAALLAFEESKKSSEFDEGWRVNDGKNQLGLWTMSATQGLNVILQNGRMIGTFIPYLLKKLN
ncbi:hypothetical protein GCM10020331_090840 [Ectobacillus funiculus]